MNEFLLVRLGHDDFNSRFSKCLRIETSLHREACAKQTNSFHPLSGGFFTGCLYDAD